MAFLTLNSQHHGQAGQGLLAGAAAWNCGCAADAAGRKCSSPGHAAYQQATRHWVLDTARQCGMETACVRGAPLNQPQQGALSTSRLEWVAEMHNTFVAADREAWAECSMAADWETQAVHSCMFFGAPSVLIVRAITLSEQKPHIIKHW